MICDICGKPYIKMGNLKADTFQEYYQDCECQEKAEKGKNEPINNK